jgi:hypothetical protein
VIRDDCSDAGNAGEKRDNVAGVRHGRLGLAIGFWRRSIFKDLEVAVRSDEQAIGRIADTRPF